MSPSPLVPDTPSPPQKSPLPPIASPSPNNNIVTTVLETGVQQPSTSNAAPTADILETLCVTTSDDTIKSELPTSLNEITSLSNNTVTLPEVDRLIDSLQNFTSRQGTNGLDSGVAVGSAPLQLDPVVSINEDSSSELLASIMGLTTVAQTTTLPSVSDAQVVRNKPSSDGVIQELSTGVAGCCSVSFTTTSLMDMLKHASTEPAPSFATCTTTTTSLFNTNDVLIANASEKAYLSPPHSTPTIFTSPQSSPLRMTSPIPEHQWLNGEVCIPLQ